MASEEPVIYKIHSLVRKVQTRLKRQKAAGRHRFVQRLAGGDITVRRARPATVTEAKLERHLAELREAVREGKIEVRTPTGRVVDILEPPPAYFDDDDLDGLEEETPVVSKPLPHPPLDSAANDKTFEHGVGEDRPLFEGGDPQGVTPESPTNLGGLVGDDENVPVQTAGDPARARAAEDAEGQAPTELPEQPDSSGLLDVIFEDGVTSPFPGTGEVNTVVPGPDLGDDSTPTPEGTEPDQAPEAVEPSDDAVPYDVGASNAADAIEHIKTIESLEEVTRVYSAEIDGKGRTTVIGALEAREAQLRGEE